MRQDVEKPCLTPERLPPTEYSGSWVGPINLVSCLISTFWHGNNYYYISFFERKTISLSRPLSKAGDLGAETQMKHTRRDFLQNPPEHLDRARLEFIGVTPSSLPCAKREEGVMLWTPA